LFHTKNYYSEKSKITKELLNAHQHTESWRSRFRFLLDYL